MNRQLNTALRRIRLHLESEGDDVVAHGPSVGAEVGGAAAATAQAGTGEAENPSTVSDTLDFYLAEIADLLTMEYDMSEDASFNFVFSAASALAKDGLVPEIPGDNASDDEIAIWMGQAKTCHFAGQVLARAREMKA